jgi:hypothetical protein
VSRVAQYIVCYGLDDRPIEVRYPPGQRIFPLASVSKPDLGPTQPPCTMSTGVLSPGLKHGRGVTLTTHPHLVSRSGMSRSYTYSPPKPLRGVSWDGFSLLYVTGVKTFRPVYNLAAVLSWMQHNPTSIVILNSRSRFEKLSCWQHGILFIVNCRKSYVCKEM